MNLNISSHKKNLINHYVTEEKTPNYGIIQRKNRSRLAMTCLKIAANLTCTTVHVTLSLFSLETIATETTVTINSSASPMSPLAVSTSSTMATGDNSNIYGSTISTWEKTYHQCITISHFFINDFHSLPEEDDTITVSQKRK